MTIAEDDIPKWFMEDIVEFDLEMQIELTKLLLEPSIITSPYVLLQLEQFEKGKKVVEDSKGIVRHLWVL